MIIEDKVIKGLFVEEDQSKMIETAPEKVLEFLKKWVSKWLFILNIFILIETYSLKQVKLYVKFKDLFN